jgi:hypothetical protein
MATTGLGLAISRRDATPTSSISFNARLVHDTVTSTLNLRSATPMLPVRG